MFLKSAISARAKILSKFPSEQFRFCFAYGSGVKQQLGYDSIDRQQTNMIDVIFCVQNSQQWHLENCDVNRTHYSAMRYIGATGITFWQTTFGAQVYFNTLVPLETGQTIKYGVVAEQHLIDDLVNWSHLYLAGRLHKPVDVLHAPTEPIQCAIKVNLSHAIRAALLLLPERFSLYQLYYMVSSLSYAGDFRMIFGENKNKVHNIVQSQMEEFDGLYADTLRTYKDFVHKPLGDRADGELIQCKKATTLSNHLQRLPTEVRRRLAAATTDAECLEKLSESRADLVAIAVRKSIDSIVWRSSIVQSIKNIPTAGLVKSLRYSWKKVLKTFQS